MESTNTSDIVQQFNETISQWINYLNDYTIAMLHVLPQQGGWSLGQVYVHLIDDTKYQLQQMKDALLQDKYYEEDMHSNAREMFRQHAFPDIRIEGPATGTIIPQPDSKEVLLEALIQIKDEVNNLHQTYDLSAAKGKSLHPGLLFFTALEWLQFMEMHMRHHFRQKKRIDNQLFTC